MENTKPLKDFLQDALSEEERKHYGYQYMFGSMFDIPDTSVPMLEGCIPMLPDDLGSILEA